MAEATEADGPDTKVECRSRRGALEIIRDIIESNKIVIKDNEDINDLEKQRITEQFEKIYTTTFTKNLQIDGQTWDEMNDADDTSEFEPKDLKKSKYINDELVAVVDNAVITTTKKRRMCPFAVKQNTMKYVNTDVLQYTKMKVNCSSSCTGECTEKNKYLSTDNVKERVGVTGEELSSLTKSLPEEVSRAERHGSAIKIFKSNKNSKTQHVLMNNSFIHTDNSLTPLKRRLDNAKVASEGTAKKLRFSRRAAQKHTISKSRLKAQ